MAYYFYRLFEVDMNTPIGKKLITDDVIISDNRETAKQLIINKHGNYPFRKTKMMISGERYYYLSDSNEYWYKYHHEEYKMKCDICGKVFTVIGGKKLYNHQNKYGSYCSSACRDELMNKIRSNDPWIDENDHLGIPKDNENNLAGYIYRITNKHTLKSYIGKTIKPPLFRWWQHLKVSNKFEQYNLSDLVFEVLEIVIFDEKSDGKKYSSKNDKLAHREMFYITHNQTADEGLNKMIETSKIETQLSLKLEECER